MLAVHQANQRSRGILRPIYIYNRYNTHAGTVPPPSPKSHLNGTLRHRYSYSYCFRFSPLSLFLSFSRSFFSYSLSLSVSLSLSLSRSRVLGHTHAHTHTHSLSLFVFSLFRVRVFPSPPLSLFRSLSRAAGSLYVLTRCWMLLQTSTEVLGIVNVRY